MSDTIHDVEGLMEQVDQLLDLYVNANDSKSAIHAMVTPDDSICQTTAAEVRRCTRSMLMCLILLDISCFFYQDQTIDGILISLREELNYLHDDPLVITLIFV